MIYSWMSSGRIFGKTFNRFSTSDQLNGCYINEIIKQCRDYECIVGFGNDTESAGIGLIHRGMDPNGQLESMKRLLCARKP